MANNGAKRTMDVTLATDQDSRTKQLTRDLEWPDLAKGI
jgi:hypothetical protein